METSSCVCFGGGASCDPAKPDGELSHMGGMELDQRLQETRASADDMTISLMWNSTVDLDLRVPAPTGEEIFYHRNATMRHTHSHTLANLSGRGSAYHGSKSQSAEHLLEAAKLWFASGTSRLSNPRLQPHFLQNLSCLCAWWCGLNYRMQQLIFFTLCFMS